MQLIIKQIGKDMTIISIKRFKKGVFFKLGVIILNVDNQYYQSSSCGNSDSYNTFTFLAKTEKPSSSLNTHCIISGNH